MNARTLTIAEATSAARKIIARSTERVDVHSWITEEALRSIGTGFHIAAHDFADGDDLRTQGNLAAWLRRYAVDTAAQTIAARGAI